MHPFYLPRSTGVARDGYRAIIFPMKTPPDTPEFRKFTDAMRGILSVSKTEMQARIAAQKESGKRLSKSSSRVSVSSSKA
jgi:hypothetical protein